MTISSLKAVAVGSIILVSCLRSAAAQEMPLCNFLDRLVESGGDNFAPFRGPFNFSIEAYVGKIWVANYLECLTTTYEGDTDYNCSRNMPDEAEEAKKEWARLADAATACFTGRMGHRIKRERFTTFNTKPHGAKVTASYHRIERKNTKKAPIYLITIRVNVSDPQQ